jgi:hypothetical protein
MTHTISAKVIAPLVLIGVLTNSLVSAQPIVDGFTKGKGNGSFVVSYSWERYDEFYFADTKRDAPPPYGGQITTQSISLYGVLGLTDNIDVILNIPFISANGEGQAPPEQEASGFQDASLFIKWRPLFIETGGGNLSFLGALGFATPLSDYSADAVLSIGNQATRADLRLMTHFVSNSGVFGELQAGYSLRSDDVPNATLLSAKLGYAAEKFYIDLWSETQISDSSAPDIGQALFFSETDSPFSQTRVNYTQIGATVFVPIVSSLGLSAGVGQYVSGRNVGLATRFSGGLVYSFRKKSTVNSPQ